MEIKVKAVAFKPPRAPGESVKGVYTVSLAPGACARDVLPLFGMEPEAILVCVRNGNAIEWTDPLCDGDELMFMRAIYGG